MTDLVAQLNIELQTLEDANQVLWHRLEATEDHAANLECSVKRKEKQVVKLEEDLTYTRVRVRDLERIIRSLTEAMK